MRDASFGWVKVRTAVTSSHSTHTDPLDSITSIFDTCFFVHCLRYSFSFQSSVPQLLYIHHPIPLLRFFNWLHYLQLLHFSLTRRPSLLIRPSSPPRPFPF